MGNYNSVTKSALRQSDYLVDEGYLHNDYERFQIIKSQKVGFDEIISYAKINTLVDKIIAIQARRETGVLKQLGVKSLKQLNQQLFTDEGISNFVTNDLEQFYQMICDGALAGLGANNFDAFKNSGTIKGQQIQEGLDKVMKQKMRKLGADYSQNFDKILVSANTGGTQLSAVRSDLLSVFNSFTDDKELEYQELYKLSEQAFAQWKNQATVHALSHLLTQFDNVKNVKVLKNFSTSGKGAKSHLTVHLENGKDFNFSAVNRKAASPGHLAFTLQGGGNGTNFNTFVNRLRDLRSVTGNSVITNTVNEIADGLTTDNFYYNLVNEALHKTTFKKSEPVVEFLNIVKSLAAAWFGVQLVNDITTANDNVDFFLIEGIGLLPMSKLLKLIKDEGNKIYVAAVSRADLDEEYYHEAKINAGIAARRPEAYGPEVREVGTEMGQRAYDEIYVNEIKLNLLISQAKGLTTYKS